MFEQRGVGAEGAGQSGTETAQSGRIGLTGPWQLALLFAAPAFFLEAGLILAWGAMISLHSGDTTTYVHGAVNLAAGNGFTECGGAVIAVYPPFYSWLLAVPITLGVWPIDALLIVGALAFATIVFTTVYFVRQCQLTSLRVMCGFTVLFSPAALLQSQAAASDAAFTAMICIFLVWLAWYLQSPRPLSLIAGAILAGLISITRFIGVVVVLEAVLLILFWGATATFTRAGLRQCFTRAFVFGAVASTPLLAFVVRNLVLTGQPFGDRGPPPPLPFEENLEMTAIAVGDWLHVDLIVGFLEMVMHKFGVADLMPVIESPPLLACVALASMITVLFVLFCLPAGRMETDCRRKGKQTTIAVIATFCVLYVLLFCIMVSIDGVADNYSRYAFPVYPMVVALTFLLLDDLRLRLPSKRRIFFFPVTAAILIWLVVPILVTARITLGHPHYLPGGIGIASAAVRQADIVQALRAIPPDALYMRTDAFSQGTIGPRPATFPLLYTGFCPRRLEADERLPADGLLFQLFADPDNGMYVGRWRDRYPAEEPALRTVFDDGSGALYGLPVVPAGSE